MFRLGPFLLVVAGALAVVFLFAIPHWSLPVAGTQLGPPGTSMIQFATLRNAEADQAPDVAPPLPPAQGDTRPATSVYKNVKVLTDLSAAEFMRTQQAMTQWVAPKQGCSFCHEPDDYSSDAKPAKQVARLMLQMTRHVNASWRNHVAAAGVTCFTCHRDKPFVARQENWNEDALTVREFFPREGWSEYLLIGELGVGQSYTALPTHEVAGQKDIKRLYEFMMQMSDGVGVNCGFCHNSRAFFDWTQSTPNRWIGYHGIEMTRDLNRNFLLQLGGLLPESRTRPHSPGQPVLPAREVNPLPGNALATCATCHHGAPQPLHGADMAAAYPALIAHEPAANPTAKPPT
jgi:photosynthetic reaction center cytochrome c subunit